MNSLNILHSAGAELVCGAGRGIVTPAAKELVTPSLIGLKGYFKVEHWRGGKRIDERQFPNGVTNEGKNFLLNVMFNGGTAKATWNLGLISGTGYTALAAADTYDNIDQAGNGWDEFASYTDPANADSAVTRPEWTEGAASGQAITNSSVVVFDLTGAGTVKGLFLAGGTNAATKSDHTLSGNILWATALFSGGDVVVTGGDQLKVTYTVNTNA